VIPIQYNSGLISVALITVSLDARLADEIADSVLKMSWAVHRADCEGYISAVKRPPFSQPVKSAPACIAVINFDEDVEQAVASAAYIQELFSGNAAMVALSASRDPISCCERCVPAATNSSAGDSTKLIFPRCWFDCISSGLRSPRETTHLGKL